MTTTTNRLRHDKHKEKRKSAEKTKASGFSRMKLFFSSMLLGGTIALSACGTSPVSQTDAGQRDAVAQQDSAKDSAGDSSCKLGIVSAPTCDNMTEPVPIIKNNKLTYTQDGILFTVSLENITPESDPSDPKGTFRFTGSDCETLWQGDLSRQTTATIPLTSDGKYSVNFTFFDRINNCNGLGALFRVSPQDCESKCQPTCGKPFETQTVSLGEGESATLNGWTVDMTRVWQLVSSACNPCQVFQHRVDLSINSPENQSEPNYGLTEFNCVTSGTSDRCVSVFVNGISQDVQYWESSGECIFSNGKATLVIKTSVP